MIEAPALQRYGPGTVSVGGLVTLELPGERVRARVAQIVSQRAIVVELESVPVTRGHMYRMGDKIPARLEEAELGPPKWVALDYRHFVAPPPPKQRRGKSRR